MQAYQLGATIASANGVVVRFAQRRADGFPVVIKVGEGDQIARLAGEATLLGTLDHENVVRVIDHGQGWLALERLMGHDLERVADTGAVPAPVAVRMVVDAARGLQAAHALRVVHRDVSPDNLFVTLDGTTKVLDFGIARSRFIEKTTEAGMVRGKLGYMSPEQIAGEVVDARADVFCLGIVLHELLAGHRLFARATPKETLVAVAAAKVLPPSALPAPLAAALMRALSRDLDMRYPSAGALADALEQTEVAQRPEVSDLVIERLGRRRSQVALTAWGEEAPLDPEVPKEAISGWTAALGQEE